MRPVRTIWLAVSILLFAAAFYAGTRYQKHRGSVSAFAAKQLSGATGLASLLHLPVKIEMQAPPHGNATVPYNPGQASHQRRSLDTALLPIVVDTMAPPRDLGIEAGAGGGMAVVGEHIIVVDHRGTFFRVEGKGQRIDRLALPTLPNHAREYQEQARKPGMVGSFHVNLGFRVHDVEAITAGPTIRLFIAYERFLPNLNTTALAVSAITIDAANWAPIGDWEPLYQSQPLTTEWYVGIAGGGRMLASGNDLYLTVGDYHQDNVFMASKLEAQNPGSDFGKILKIDLRTKEKSVVSIGHRNPQGLAFTSRGLYATEHGPRGGDELNRIELGKNYGWPIASFGTHYLNYDWRQADASGTDESFEKPVFVWLPSIGASNLIEIANLHAAWDGDLMVASLAARSLFRLRSDEAGRVIYSEPIPIGERLRDIATLADGTVVLWTDQAHLIFLSVDAARLASNRRPH